MWANIPGNACLHYIYGLEDSMFKDAAPEELSVTIELFAYSFRRLIAVILEKITSQSLSSSLMVFHNIESIVAIFPGVLRALRQLESSEKLFAVSIHHITQILGSLMAANAELSVTECFDLWRQNDGSQTIDFCSLQSSIALPQRTGFLCRIIILILESLNANESADNAIMEGFLACLLNRIGRCLRWAMHHRSMPNNEAESIQLSAFEDLRTQSNLRLEAQMPHLTWLLRETLPIAKMFGPALGMEQLLLTDERTFRPPPGELSRHAWTSLQQKLVQAVFHTGNESHETPCKQGQQLYQRSGTTSIERLSATRCESFKRAIWRFIGWDVLHAMVRQRIQRDSIP